MNFDVWVNNPNTLGLLIIGCTQVHAEKVGNKLAKQILRFCLQISFMES